MSTTTAEQSAAKFAKKIKEVSKKLDTAASVFAGDRMRACIAEPQKYLNDPVTYLAAEYVFNDQPLHQCYWNNRFAIAVTCALPWHTQQLAAWCAVTNSVNLYWEWRTHAGYDMKKVLERLGLKDCNYDIVGVQPIYYRLAERDMRQLCKLFDLPTLMFGVKKELSREEEEQAASFGAEYPHICQL